MQAPDWLLPFFLGALLYTVYYALLGPAPPPCPHAPPHPSAKPYVSPSPQTYMHFKGEAALPARLLNRTAVARAACARLSLPFVSSASRGGYLLDTPHRLAYCRVAKAGTSFILTYMLELNGVDTLPIKRVHAPAFEALNYTVDLTNANNLRKRFTLEVTNAELNHHFKFMVVRHPFERIVSSYFDKVVDHKYYTDGWIRSAEANVKGLVRFLKEHLPIMIRKTDGTSAHLDNEKNLRTFLKDYDININERGMSQGSPPGFPEFIRFVLSQHLGCDGKSQCLRRNDVHILLQLARCNPCLEPYDAIFKVETLKDDFASLEEHLGLPNETRSTISKKTVQKKSLAMRILRRRASGRGNGPSLEDVPAEQAEIPNTTGRTKSDFKHVMSQLSQLETDLLYTAFYEDFQVFGYEI